MLNNQNSIKKIYLEGEKGIIHERIKSKCFIYEDSDGLVATGGKAFITRNIKDDRVYSYYDKYKELNLEKDEIEKIEHIFGELVNMASRETASKKGAYLDNDIILKKYIDKLNIDEIKSYLEQIEKHKEIAQLTKYFIK